MLHGIDVAANNGLAHIELAQDFGIVKSTESTHYHNPNHPTQVAALRKLGKLVGHYHFLYTTVSPTDQAKWFLDNTTIEPGDVVAVDVEQQVHGLLVGTVAERLAATVLWLRAIREALNVKPWVYSYPDYLRQLTTGEALKYGKTLAELRSYPLWIAEYNGRDVVNSGDMYGWQVWTAHQNADQPYVDRDAFNGDRDTWAKLAVPHPVAPKPPAPPALPVVTITAPKNVTVKVVQS